jgi:hypothetical protein
VAGKIANNQPYKPFKEDGMHMRVDPIRQESGQTTAEQFSPEQEERIRRRAHQIYEERGREEGHALNHWLQAKSEVVNRDRSLKAVA